MASNAALRQQRWRDRRKADKRCLMVEVDEVRLAAVLADQGHFLKTESPRRQELEDAVARVLEALITRYEQERWPSV